MDRVGLLVEILGDRDAIRSLERLQMAKKELENNRISLKVDSNSVARDVNELRKALTALQREQRNYKRGSDIYKSYSAQIQSIKDEIKDLTHMKKDIDLSVNANTTQLQAVNSQLSEVERKAYSIKDVLGGLGSAFSSLGGAMQSMGGLFNTDIFGYAKQALTWMTTGQIMKNMDAAISRFDIMNTYEPYMNLVGISADVAQESINKVNEAIQGLPIGLDEAAFQTRRYTMLLGNDAQKATKLVIGLNKALIAGGAPEQMRNYAEFEIQRLLSSGDLATSRQWMSLINGLGVSVQYLKDAMGYGDIGVDEFIKELTAADSEITGNQFLEGLMNLADSDSLDSALDVYKSTLESGLSNIKFAFTRGTTGVMQALNDVFEQTKGMGFTDYLYEGRNLINEVFTGIADFVRDNPDLIEGGLDRLHGLVERAGQFDWPKLGSSIIGSLESLVDVLTWVYDHIPENILQKFLTFSLVWASPLGKAFSTFGGFLTTLSKIPTPNLGGIFKFGAKGGASGLAGFKTMGQNLLGVAGFVGVIAEVGAVVFEFAKVGEAIAKADFTGFDKNIGRLMDMVTQVGLFVGALTAVFTGISATGIGGLAVAAGEGLTAGLIGIIGETALVVHEFINVSDALSEMKIPTDAKMGQFGDFIKELSKIFGPGLDKFTIPLRKIKRFTKAIKQLEKLSESLDSFKAIETSDVNVELVKEKLKPLVDIVEFLNSDLNEEFRFGDGVRSNRNVKIVENMHAIVDELTQTASSIQEAYKAIDQMTMVVCGTGVDSPQEQARKIETIKTSLEDTLGILLDLQGEMSNNFGITAFDDVFRTGNEVKIVDNLNTIVQELGQTSDAVKEAYKQISEMNNSTDLNDFTNQAEELIGKLNSIAKAIDDSWTSFGTGDESQKDRNRAQSIEYIKQSIQSLVDVAQLISDNKGLMLWGGFKGSGIGTIGETVQNIKNFIGQIVGVRKSEGGDGGTGLAGYFTDLANLGTNNLATKVQSVSDAITQLGQIASTIQANKEAFADIVNEGTLGKAQHIFESIKTLFSNMPEDTGDIAQKMQDIHDAMSKFASAVRVMDGVKDMVAGLSGEGSFIQSASTLISSLVTALSGGEDLSGALNTLSQMSDAITTFKATLEELGTVDLSDLYGALDKTTQNTNTLKSAVDDLNASLQQLAQKSFFAQTSIIRMSDIMSQKSGVIAGIAAMFNSLAASANSAAYAVGAVRTAMNNIQSKTVTLNVNRNVNTAIRNPGSLLNDILHRSKGGAVYLAKGGSPFKPKGTDTVPAMLTPGEYVVNRRATQFFGQKFMDRINRLDISGAMDTLMRSSRWIPNRGNVINNYDNHATVNQTFGSPKDKKASYRRAGRYIGAL